MTKLPRSLIFSAAALVALTVIAIPRAQAADMKPADRAWIAKCIADRKAGVANPKALRPYCACMQQIVEDNQTFGVTDLERTYPPAHQMCWRDAKLRPKLAAR
jgi:hypothetical protein